MRIAAIVASWMLVAGPGPALAQSSTGEHALSGIVDKIDTAARTVAVKVKDGTTVVVHETERTVKHGPRPPGGRPRRGALLERGWPGGRPDGKARRREGRLDVEGHHRRWTRRRGPSRSGNGRGRRARLPVAEDGVVSAAGRRDTRPQKPGIT